MFIHITNTLMRCFFLLFSFVFALLVLGLVGAVGGSRECLPPASGPTGSRNVMEPIPNTALSTEPACVWCLIPPNCFPVPSDCPKPSIMCDPVCGCNGITYENECIAKVLNCVPCVTEGPCLSTRHNNLRVHDTAQDECVLPPVCDPGGVACPMSGEVDALVYAPVCGCNGVTYGNKCEATELNCVPWVTPGSCPTSLRPTSFTE